VRCANCGARIVELPRYLERSVKIKCHNCFGAAPQDSSPGIDELLNRGYRRDLQRLGEATEGA